MADDEQEDRPDQPDEPQQEPTEREVGAVHLRWLGAAAGKNAHGLLEQLYSLRRRRRRTGT